MPNYSHLKSVLCKVDKAEWHYLKHHSGSLRRGGSGEEELIWDDSGEGGEEEGW